MIWHYSISPGWPPIHPWPWVAFSVARWRPPTSALRRLQSLIWADGCTTLAHMGRGIVWLKGGEEGGRGFGVRAKMGFNFFGRVESMLSWMRTPTQQSPVSCIRWPYQFFFLHGLQWTHIPDLFFFLSLTIYIIVWIHMPIWALSSLSKSLNLPVLRKSVST